MYLLILGLDLAHLCFGIKRFHSLGCLLVGLGLSELWGATLHEFTLGLVEVEVQFCKNSLIFVNDGFLLGLGDGPDKLLDQPHLKQCLQFGHDVCH